MVAPVVRSRPIARAIRIVFGIQLVLGAVWTLSLVTVGQGSYTGLYLFFYIYPLHLLFFLFAAVVFWQRKADRKVAAWVMLLPFVLLYLPSVVKSLFGGPLEDRVVLNFLGISVLALLGFMVAVPKRASGWMPEFFYRSGWLNGLIVLLQALCWLLPIAAIALVASDGAPRSGGSSSGMGAAILLVGGAIYIVATGVGSLIAAVHGWLGLRSGVEGARRGLHVTQLALAVPAILIAIPTLGWLTSQQG